jgi:hypothetical protein
MLQSLITFHRRPVVKLDVKLAIQRHPFMIALQQWADGEWQWPNGTLKRFVKRSMG